MVKPQGVRANSWRDVADLSASLGVALDDWQELVLQTAMGERADATWAAKRVGISVPRQNGKSQLLVARALAGALLFGEKKIVVSAHQQDTAREAFAKLMEIIEDDRNEALRSRLDSRFGRGGVMNALNREAVRFTTGATIQFKARSGAAGKGFSSDCLLLDEAQILGSRAWTSINSTMSAMPNPQVWLLGTPPQAEDDDYAFAMVRKAALAGASTAAAWLEWAADPNAADFDPASEYTRWSANPAWNVRINHEVVQGEYETYSPDKFNQDRLGIWREDGKATKRRISEDEWSAARVATAPDGGIASFGVAFGFDGDHMSVAGAMRDGDGTHVELIGALPTTSSAGVEEVAAWLAARWRTTAQITLVGGSLAKVMWQALRDHGVPSKVIKVASTPDYFAACAMFHDGIRSGQVTVPAPKDVRTDLLEQTVAVCDAKPRLGGWGWTSTHPDLSPTPLDAASVALWGAKTSTRKPGRKQVML